MKYSQVLAVGTLYLIYQTVKHLPGGTATVFDFLLLPNNTNTTDGEQWCKEFGFDGLAVLSSPEAFHQALKVTADMRSVNMGIDIGLRYLNDSDSFQWDDGRDATPDIPWWKNQPKPHKCPFCRIYFAGFLMSHSGKGRKRSLCGKYGMNEAKGSTIKGSELDALPDMILAETTATSYLSCVVKCGMETRCRATVFKSDLSSCRLFNTNLPTNVTILDNPLAQTFLRTRYPVLPPNI